MEHLIYASIILLAIALFLYLWNGEHRKAERVKKEKEAFENEDLRMFDFLHGLGEALMEDTSPGHMHRYITGGITEVVGAEAGILYLVNHEDDRIVPVAQTEKTAPVLGIPKELHDDQELLNRKYRSLIRLTPLDKGQGLVGDMLNQGTLFSLDNLADYFPEDEIIDRYHTDTSLLGSPLFYANKQIGAIAVTRQGQGKFNQHDRDVFASVAEQCSIALGSAIIHAEAHEKRRLEQELSQASEIQRILLPKKNPELSDYRLAATYRPARHVSGDYYDYVKIDDDHYGVAIADVCGKGIAASLIMAMCRSSLRTHTKKNLSPAGVLHKVNASIFPDIREDMFVSFLYLILERDSNRISLSNAGHEPPLIRRKKTGKVEENEIPGMAAGVDKGGVFSRVVKDHQIEMDPGDIILLYTDGLIEALNTEGEEFGFDRFIRAFETAKGDSADAVLSSVIGEIEDFSQGTNATDDITLIAVEKR